MDGWKAVWDELYGRIELWMEGLDGWKDGLKDGWMDGWKNACWLEVPR
jgi:hypothetical protein